jgi:hypothetical protein
MRKPPGERRLKPNSKKPRERGWGIIAAVQPGVNAGSITAGAASPVNGANQA